MVEQVHVVVIPGLGDQIREHLWASSKWRKFGIIPYVFDTQWNTAEKFKEKLNRCLNLIDTLIATQKRVSIIGNSAGSSFAVNILAARREKIYRIVVNCGRVRSGDWPWFTFDQATAKNPSFKESVLRSERVLLKLSWEERKKILTLRPLFDETVPFFTVPIKGAVNEITPSVEHVTTIALNMTLFSPRIIKFLRD